MSKIIRLDVYNLDVVVFNDYASRLEFLAGQGVDEPATLNEIEVGGVSFDLTRDMEPRLSMVLKDGVTIGDCARACSHMADLLCNVLGVPISFDATTIRAYFVGYMMDCLREMGVAP